MMLATAVMVINLGIDLTYGKRPATPAVGFADSQSRAGIGGVAGKGAGGPHAGLAMDRAGATDSYGGGEGDRVRGVAYGAISRNG